MKFLKRSILPISLLLVLLIVVIKLDDISNIIGNLLKSNPTLVILPSNEYTKDDKYLYVWPTEEYVPYSYQDLINIFYSVINNGWEKFTFYCPSEYVDCINDVRSISDDNELLTHLNNYTHPYNNFNNFKTIFDESGEVTIEINHLYDKKMIDEINTKVRSILSQITNDSMDNESKLLAIHDYIINNAKYDITKNQTGVSDYHSNIAYGALLEGYAICGGYSDAMAIFLTELGIKNYKIASTTHVWNAVYINNKWVHLDLTWDDPVSEQGVDYLYHKYFLVNNTELKKADGNLNNHEFNKAVYLEFKN